MVDVVIAMKATQTMKIAALITPKNAVRST